MKNVAKISSMIRKKKIDEWLQLNKLKLNENKTKIMEINLN